MKLNLRRDSLGQLGCWLCVLFLALPCATRAEDRIYVVKRQDTLSGIARHFVVSVAHPDNRNDLPRTMQINAGQRLIIPGKSPPPVKPASSPATPLPAAIQKGLEKAKVAPGRWKYIVIHHSG